MSDMAQPLRQPIPEPPSYSDRIRELVAEGEILEAQKLLAEALAQAESSEDLSHWERLLRPTKTFKVGGAKAPDPAPDIQWLYEHSKEYDGQWVALRNGELLTSASSLKEVLSTLKEKEPEQATLLHRIYHQPEPAGLSEARTYAEKIRMLVEADFVGEARKVLAEALERGDHGEDLSGWQRVLAPARVISVGGERDLDRTADFQWLKDHSRAYRGQWVALLGGELLAHDEALQSILNQLKSHPSGHQALLHRIH